MERLVASITVLAVGVWSVAGLGVSQRPVGDVNRDMEVDVLDLQQVLTDVLHATSTSAADVNRDGEVNLLDYQATLYFASGEEFPPISQEDEPREEGVTVKRAPSPANVKVCVAILDVARTLKPACHMSR